ncbi:hypothetical protein KJ909_02145 [Patescibacteria group bacterium]|nr:hypothetical protein [Patescibacteria group bacterium]
MTLFKFFSRQLSFLGHLWQNSTVTKFFRWNVVVIILQIVFILLNFSDLPLKIPFYYSRPWGESRLAPVSSLFLLPTASTLILFLNYFILASFLFSSPLFSYLLAVFSLLFSSFFLISVFKIISLVS